jgi:tetratricopeptide (TPR) repeat protein
MEHAHLKGIRCHRDIKPANIMIGSDSTVKITDFGLAGALGMSKAVSGIRLNVQQGVVGLSGQTMEGTGFGTPTHMPPEQFTDAASCDERSDIYSFGVVLFQMASGGRLPFVAQLPKDASEAESARFWRTMHRLHADHAVPVVVSPLFPVIRHCLEKDPRERFADFAGFRLELVELLLRETGEAVVVPSQEDLAWWEWGNRGLSFSRLGRHEEAIRCYDRVLGAGPREKRSLNNKAVSLNDLGRHAEALKCLAEALELNPGDPGALTNTGITLNHLGRYQEALERLDQALDIAPKATAALTNKGICLDNLGRTDEALRCYDMALAIDRNCQLAWYNKGDALSRLKRFKDAIDCFDEALRVNPVSAVAWHRKALCFAAQDLFDDELSCWRRTLELDPSNAEAWHIRALAEEAFGRSDDAEASFRKFLEVTDNTTGEDAKRARNWLAGHEANVLNEKGARMLAEGRNEDALACFDGALGHVSGHPGALANKGYVLSQLGRNAEAIVCLDRAIAVEPRDSYSLYFKGICLYKMHHYAEALPCFRRAIEISPTAAVIWYNKALAEDELGMAADVVHSLRRFLEVAPADATSQLEYARKRLRELDGR